MSKDSESDSDKSKKTGRLLPEKPKQALIPENDVYLVEDMIEFEAPAMLYELDVVLRDEFRKASMSWIGDFFNRLNGAVATQDSDDEYKWNVLAEEQTVEYLLQSFGKYCRISRRNAYHSDSVKIRKKGITLGPKPE